MQLGLHGLPLKTIKESSAISYFLRPLAARGELVGESK